MSRPDAAPRNRFLLPVALGAILLAGSIIAVIALSSPKDGPYSVTDGKITIESAAMGSFGTVLVTDKGFALYTFPPDERAKVACTDRCAVNWPPVVVPDDAALQAGKGVDPSRLGLTAREDGTKVASYDGWPLYTYLGDVTAGTAKGQGQYLDGGYWYLIRPGGQVVKPGQ